MKRINTKGIVLKRVKYGEADRIFTLLTDKLGRVSAYGKGVRRIKSKLAGALEPFMVADILLIEGKSDVYTISSAKAYDHYEIFTSDYDLSSQGYEALKAVEKITRHGGGEDLFDILHEYFNLMRTHYSQGEAVWLWFMLAILDKLGHKPNLEHDEAGVVLSEDLSYHMDYNAGSLVPTGNQNTKILKPEHIKTWRLLQSKPFEEAIKINGVEEAASQSQAICKEFLDYVI